MFRFISLKIHFTGNRKRRYGSNFNFTKIASMTPAYKRTIKLEYDRLVAESRLSPGLISPTTKNIREECLKKMRVGVEKEDMRALLDFFDEIKPDNLEKKISNWELDDFKTVWKFLKGDTEQPNYKVVELVAWLIDYPHRPYSPKKDYPLGEPSPENTPGPDKQPLKEVVTTEELPIENP